MRNRTVKVVGLTGGIATGKSVVSNMFRKLGAFVVDADRIARELTLPNSPIARRIREKLGKDIMAEDGGIDRRRLRNRIIEDDSARFTLNRILHPAIVEREEMIIRQSDAPLILVDAALLIETGSYKRFRDVILVYAPRWLQLKRLMERDNMDELSANRFIDTQMDIEKKRNYATHLIDNTGNFSQTEKQVRRLYALLSA